MTVASRHVAIATLCLARRTKKALLVKVPAYYDGFKSDGLGLRGCVKKFVALDLGGDAHVAILAVLYTHDLTMAPYVHVAGLGHLFGKSDYEFDRAAYIEFRIGKKIKAAITDIPCLCFEFQSARFVGKHPQRKGHREAPCFAAFGSVAHESSLCGDCENLKNANTRPTKLQSEKPSFLS